MRLLKRSCSCLCLLIGLISVIYIENKSTLFYLGSSERESIEDFCGGFLEVLS